MRAITLIIFETYLISFNFFFCIPLTLNKFESYLKVDIKVKKGYHVTYK
jgi:hypothetical protein